jgi:hypothetical protein
MSVVADTGPLNYLIQIDCDGLLPELYGRIVVPASVMKELGHAAAPAPSAGSWFFGNVQYRLKIPP